MADERQQAGVAVIDPDEPVPQRPLGVWFILAYFGIGLISTPFSLWYANSMGAMPPGSLVLVAIGMLVNFAGAVSLFRLQAVAIRVFAVSAGVALVASVYGLIAIDVEKIVPPPGLDVATFLRSYRLGQMGAVAFSIVVYSAIIFYLFRLRRSGTLR